LKFKSSKASGQKGERERGGQHTHLVDSYETSSILLCGVVIDIMSKYEEPNCFLKAHILTKLNV
jgi:hypothetical protein